MAAMGRAVEPPPPHLSHGDTSVRLHWGWLQTRWLSSIRRSCHPTLPLQAGICKRGGMTWILIAIIGVLTWIVATLAIDAYLRRPRRKSLGDRLFLYRGPYVADDAQDWLTDRK
jgi:hypothetical protein